MQTDKLLSDLLNDLEDDEKNKNNIISKKKSRRKKGQKAKHVEVVCDKKEFIQSIKEKIEVHQEALTQALSAITCLLNENLTLDQAVKDDKRIVEEFVCVICTCIATEDMVRCAEDCEGTYCRVCIESWMDKSDKCPLCSQTFIEEKVQRKYLNLLKSSQFNCLESDCKKTFTYANKNTHYLTECAKT